MLVRSHAPTAPAAGRSVIAVPVMVVALLALVVGLAWYATDDELRRVESAAVTAEGGPAAASELDAEGRDSTNDAPSAPGGDARSAVGDESIYDGPTHRLSGLVIGPGRYPAAGAEVALRGEGAPRLTTVTDAEGRYELEMTTSEPGSWSIHVIGDGGLAGRQRLFLADPAAGEVVDVSVRTIVLEEAYGLRVAVRRAGAPVPDIAVTLDVGEYRLPFAESRTDADGVARFDDLSRGRVRVSVIDGEQGARVETWVPDAAECTLHLAPLDFRVIEVVDAGSGSPIAGAEARLSTTLDMARSDGRRIDDPGFSHSDAGLHADLDRLTTRTGDDGKARIGPFFPGFRAYCKVAADGYLPNTSATLSLRRSDNYGVELVAGDDVVRIPLMAKPSRALRWPIASSEVPPPAEGAVVRFEAITSRRHDAAADVRDGRFEANAIVGVSFGPAGPARAYLPDGSFALVSVPEIDEEPSAVDVVRPRAITVTVVDEAGAPIERAVVHAYTTGNVRIGVPAVTDRDGLARIESLDPLPCDVHLLSTPGGPSMQGMRNAGTVDLTAGDAELRIVHRPEPRGEVRIVTILDGVARLPDDFRVSGRRAPLVESEDPGEGALVVSYLSNEGIAGDLHVKAAGYGTQVVDVTGLDPSTRPSLRVEFESQCVVEIDVDRPEGTRVAILPQRFDEETGEWAKPSQLRSLFRGLNNPNGAGDRFVFGDVPPGRWRGVDERSGASSDPVTIGPGESGVVRLDVVQSEWVEGVVECEGGASLEHARVVPRAGDRVLNGGDLDWFSRPGVGVYDGGRFRVAVPVGEDTRIVAWHPYLVPHAEYGSVVLRGGRSDVVLRLVLGDQLVIPLTNPEVVGPLARVGRYAAGGGFDGAPIEWHKGALDGELLRAAIPAGTWDLYVDPGDVAGAPLEFRDLRIAGETRVDRTSFPRGSVVRVHLVGASDAIVPRVSIHAVRQSEPEVSRLMNSRGEDAPELAGLPAGRYRVTLHSFGSALDWQEREVTLDGTSVLELEAAIR